MVGDTWGYEAYFLPLERMARELALPEVVFTGQVEDAELPAFYEAADVFLCLSEHEGFCVPLLEAMSHGVPVLAYDAGAVAETLRGRRSPSQGQAARGGGRARAPGRDRQGAAGGGARHPGTHAARDAGRGLCARAPGIGWLRFSTLPPPHGPDDAAAPRPALLEARLGRAPPARHLPRPPGRLSRDRSRTGRPDPPARGPGRTCRGRRARRAPRGLAALARARQPRGGRGRRPRGRPCVRSCPWAAASPATFPTTFRARCSGASWTCAGTCATFTSCSRKRWRAVWLPVPAPRSTASCPCSSASTPRCRYRCASLQEPSSPRQKSASALLRVVFLAEPRHPIRDPKALERLVQAAFARRRRTLENNLQDSYPNLKQYLRLLNIAGSRRAETLSVVEFSKLAEALSGTEVTKGPADAGRNA